MAEEDLDKSHPATAHKLEHARRKGQVAKSPDIVGAGIIGVLVLFVYAYADRTWAELLRLCYQIFSVAGRLGGGVQQFETAISEFGSRAAAIVAPLTLLVLLAAFLGNFVQVGAIFTTDPLKPSLDRLNPANGWRRLFSLRTVYDAGRGLLKVALIAVVVVLAIVSLAPKLLASGGLPANAYSSVLIASAASVLAKCAVAMMVLALADLAFTRWEFARKQRMSNRELKDEIKQREGEPRLRMKLRQLRVELLKRAKGIRNLPGADVVVTNPEHVAVALRYKHGEMIAPVLVAKGVGYQAATIRKIAVKHAIPIVHRPALARAINRNVDFEGVLPEEYFAEVAKILVSVHRRRQSGPEPVPV